MIFVSLLTWRSRPWEGSKTEEEDWFAEREKGGVKELLREVAPIRPRWDV